MTSFNPKLSGKFVALSSVPGRSKTECVEASDVEEISDFRTKVAQRFAGEHGAYETPMPMKPDPSHG